MIDRVEKCEDGVKDAVTKMNDVLAKLEEIDRSKRERREAMDDLLGQINDYVKPGVEGNFPWYTDDDVTASKLSNRTSKNSAGNMQSYKSLTSQVCRKNLFFFFFFFFVFLLFLRK